MNESFEKLIVGDIVAGDFRAAAVFERFGIDFCCGGQRSIADACGSASVSPSDVEAVLATLAPVANAEDDVTRWPLDRLVDYIVTTHHAYVRTMLPVIRGYLSKLVDVHGRRHPEAIAAFPCSYSTSAAAFDLRVQRGPRTRRRSLRTGAPCR